MKGYFFFGGLRNLFGIGLLTYLTHLGFSLSPALLLVVIVGFALYIAQVRFFVGSVAVRTIGKTFVLVYFANRLSLWAFHEKLGLKIYFAQFISIALFTTGSFLYLKHCHNAVTQTKKDLSSKKNTPFPVAAYKQLVTAEARHWWFRSRNKILLWIIKSKINTFRNFLEIGCGTGYVLDGIRHAYPEADLFGAEFFEEGLVHARQRVPSASFLQIDARNMQQTECFDVIGAFDVLEHIEEDVKVLENLQRGLRSNGWLILTVPQHPRLWSASDDHACHVRRYTRKELLEKTNGAGFKVIYLTSFVSCLLPLMWLARRKNRQLDYEPMSELIIPGWLNITLEKVMSFELLLLKMGCTFPVGGSLLLLAKKSCVSC